jgi:hypothetical protein
MDSAGHSAGVRSARDLRHELIAELYREGLPVADIARRAVVGIKTVRNVARRAGLPPRNPSRPERDGEILVRYIAGDPVDAIATDCGVRRSRVRVVAARAGIPPRKGWQRLYPLDEYAFYEYVGCPERPLTLLNLSEAARARQLPRRPAAEGRSSRRGSSRPWHAMGSSRERPLRSHSVRRLRVSERYGWGSSTGTGRWGSTATRAGVRFSGTRRLMEQCEAFWRETLPLRSSQRSLRRKRAILAEIAAYRPNKVL